ncbi:MAG: hypothetical protein HY782_05390 [Chloroflexi bacterium]|nr:hypothetical protein [Chloroflexota bacterium]
MTGGRLFTPGEPTASPNAFLPPHRRDGYTARHEIVLRPGDQVTLPPNTPHWFQGGPHGAVIWSLSTQAIDNQDVFTDPSVRRQTIVG